MGLELRRLGVISVTLRHLKKKKKERNASNKTVLRKNEKVSNSIHILDITTGVYVAEAQRWLGNRQVDQMPGKKGPPV